MLCTAEHCWTAASGRVDTGRGVVPTTLLRGAVRGTAQGTVHRTVREIDILVVGRSVLTAGICTDVLHQHLLPLHSVSENMI